MPLSKIEPTIVYQDEYIFVLDKKPNCHSVLHVNHPQDSLAYWIKTNFPAQAEIGKTEHDCGLVQRLDFETSGLILAARTQDVWEKLFQKLKNGEITKEYHCLMEGCLSKEPVEVNGFIGSPYRRPSKMKFWTKKPDKIDRVLPASSVFKSEKYFKKKNYSLVRVTAPTARRHQIRVSAQSIKHPLVGDELYGANMALDLPEYPARFFLQASYLAFRHPLSGKKIEFSKELTIRID